MVAANPAPTISSNNLLLKVLKNRSWTITVSRVCLLNFYLGSHLTRILVLQIRAIEATLTSALRREQQAQLAAKRYATEIDQLQTLVSRDFYAVFRQIRMLSQSNTCRTTRLMSIELVESHIMDI